MHWPGYVQGGQEVECGFLLLGIHYRRIPGDIHPLQAVVGIRDILMRLQIRICGSAPLEKWIRLRIQFQIRLLSSVTLKGHGNEPDFLFFCINCLQNPAQACWLFDSFTTNLLSNFYIPHCYNLASANVCWLILLCQLISWLLNYSK